MEDIMKRYFLKFTSIVMIMSLFGSCMTIVPDNRGEAVVELTKLGRVSASVSPLVSNIGPVRTINALSNNAALMVAGQLGVQLGYEYFVILERRTNQHISGSVYRGTGGVTTTIVHSITVAYTNEEIHDGRFLTNASSSMLDGHTFTTSGGRTASWLLFGTTALLGSIIMISSASLDWDDPRADSRLIGGGVLMGASLLFTIPLYY